MFVLIYFSFYIYKITPYKTVMEKKGWFAMPTPTALVLELISQSTIGTQHRKKFSWSDFSTLKKGRSYSPFPRTPATIPIMNTAARTNKPNARKFDPEGNQSDNILLLGLTDLQS
jgi:hypothetical protein